MVLGPYSKRVTMTGVFAGDVTGVFVFVALALTRHDPIMGLNAGLIALCRNVVVVVAVSLRRYGFDDHSRASIRA